jgi:ABC-2 type transport system permease protein
MSSRRVLTLALRVIRQVVRDRRTVALFVIGPLLVLTLGAILLRSKPSAIPLGAVNEDEGVTSPLVGTMDLGQRIVDELAASGTFTMVAVRRSEVDDRLRDGTVQGVIVFPQDFTTLFLKDRQAVLDLRLEGSNPERSTVIIARVTQAAMETLASLAETQIGAAASSPAATGTGALPVTVQASYLYGGEQFDTLDYVGPVYIAGLAMFFVFLLACVAFVRERSRGTMERLAATPTTWVEIVLGYMLGLGLFALLQVTLILLFTVWVLQIHYLGSLALLLVVSALLAVVGVDLGILASAFARNEFQVLQFIPILILPQVFLGGTFWAVSDMPGYLRPFAYLMPLRYANEAMRDVMLKGRGLAEIWPNLGILVGFAVMLVILSALVMRHELA